MEQNKEDIQSTLKLLSKLIVDNNNNSWPQTIVSNTAKDQKRVLRPIKYHYPWMRVMLRPTNKKT